jgi:hypothetical protein
MAKENVAYIHNGVLFSHKMEQNKPDSKRQVSHVFSPMWNLDLKSNKRRHEQRETIREKERYRVGEEGGR